MNTKVRAGRARPDPSESVSATAKFVAWLNGVLIEHARIQDPVRRVLREPSGFRTLFQVEVLHLEMSDGSSRRLFMKTRGTEQADHPDKQARNRECRVYASLLSGRDLPVVDFHGCHIPPGDGRMVILLEYVPDWNLKYQTLDHWFTAVRQLARLHRHFGDRVHLLRGVDCLLPLDADYHLRWARRALDVVARNSASDARALEPVIEAYDDIADLVSSQPATLVHNDLGHKNVLVDRSQRPARICFVDWEMAGIGCALHDLVHLRFDRLDPVTDASVMQTYFDAMQGSPLVPQDPDRREQVVMACELHRILYRLAHVVDWNKPAAYRRHLVARARGVMDALAGRGPRGGIRL